MISQRSSLPPIDPTIYRLEQAITDPKSNLHDLIAETEKLIATNRSALEKNESEYKKILKVYKKGLNALSDRYGRIEHHLFLELDNISDASDKDSPITHQYLINYTSNIYAETVDYILSKTDIHERTLALEGRIAMMKRRFDKGHYLTATYMLYAFITDRNISRLIHTIEGLSPEARKALAEIEVLLDKAKPFRETLISTRSKPIVPPFDFIRGKFAQINENIEQIEDEILATKKRLPIDKGKLIQLHKIRAEFEAKKIPLEQEVRQLQLENLVQPINNQIAALKDKKFFAQLNHEKDTTKEIKYKIEKLENEKERLLTSDIDIKQELLKNPYLSSDRTRLIYYRSQLDLVKATILADEKKHQTYKNQYQELDKKKWKLINNYSNYPKAEQRTVTETIQNFEEKLFELDNKIKEVKKQINQLESQKQILQSDGDKLEKVIYEHSIEEPFANTLHKKMIAPASKYFFQPFKREDKRRNSLVVMSHKSIDDQRYEQSILLEPDTVNHNVDWTKKLKSLLIKTKSSTIIEGMPLSIVEAKEINISNMTKITYKLKNVKEDIIESNGKIWGKIGELKELQDGSSDERNRKNIERIATQLAAINTHVSTNAYAGGIPQSIFTRGLEFVRLEIDDPENNRHIHFDKIKKSRGQDKRLVVWLKELEQLLCGQQKLVEEETRLQDAIGKINSTKISKKSVKTNKTEDGLKIEAKHESEEIVIVETDSEPSSLIVIQPTDKPFYAKAEKLQLEITQENSSILNSQEEVKIANVKPSNDIVSEKQVPKVDELQQRNESIGNTSAFLKRSMSVNTEKPPQPEDSQPVAERVLKQSTSFSSSFRTENPDCHKSERMKGLLKKFEKFQNQSEASEEKKVSVTKVGNFKDARLNPLKKEETHQRVINKIKV